MCYSNVTLSAYKEFKRANPNIKVGYILYASRAHLKECKG